MCVCVCVYVPGPAVVVWQVDPVKPTLQEHSPTLLHICVKQSIVGV